jgi:hypothetical protein
MTEITEINVEGKKLKEGDMTEEGEILSFFVGGDKVWAWIYGKKQPIKVEKLCYKV